MKVADVDQNGTIDKTEFSNFMVQLYDEITHEKAEQVFDNHNAEGKGWLDVERFAAAIFEGVTE